MEVPMKTKNLAIGLFIVAAGFSLLSLNARAVPDLNSCTKCHSTAANTDGNGYPLLEGMDSKYFIKTMTEYKSGERASDLMARRARKLTDQTIAEYAAYFAAQRRNPGIKGADVSMANGKKFFELAVKGRDGASIQCSSCHGLNGEGTAKGPILAGQDKNYLISAMKAYHQNDGGRKDAAMASATELLRDTEIEDLAVYLQSL
jgi:cytochrome c553